jgi:hypothetical protein
VYLYYKLQRFYQNHRRYVKSRDDSQLHGRDTPVQSVCDPLATTADGQAYAPCGFIANSMFNGMGWDGMGWDEVGSTGSLLERTPHRAMPGTLAKFPTSIGKTIL